MPKKTIGLVVSLFVITVILLVAALRTKPSAPITVPEQVTQTPVASVAQTTLSLSPNTMYLTAAPSGSADVMIDTKENEVTAVQLEVQYDPKVITNVKITTEDFFEDPIVLINTNDPKAGRATYALGISPAQSPTKGTGVVAKISFTKVARTTAQETMLELLPTSLVTSSGVDESVLKSATGAQLILSQ